MFRKLTEIEKAEIVLILKPHPGLQGALREHFMAETQEQQNLGEVSSALVSELTIPQEEPSP